MSEPICTVLMKRGKETKSTYRYEAEDAEAQALTLVYVKKSAFSGRIPDEVEVVVRPSA